MNLPADSAVRDYTDRDYQRRCDDLEMALAWALDKIDEWDVRDDPHGWWHERPRLIALCEALGVEVER